MLYIFFAIVLAFCFLLGMTWLRVGLFNLSGTKMKEMLQRVTTTPINGMIAGIIMTVILQSSSAVTVITVGLVSARILTFPQTIGIILGTNIGTTITLQFFTFDITNYIIPFFLIGIFLQFFNKFRSYSFIFLGIGIIFTAMNGFVWISEPFAQIEYIQQFLGLMSKHLLLAFLVGTLLTAIVQSSTVMTGIAMSFLMTGTITLESSIAIMIGANIGTCATALLAAIGAGREASLTAFAHLWLNIGGAVIFIPFVSFLAYISSWVAQSPATQLAHASVIYNVLCSLLVLPFAEQFGRLIIKFHGRR